MTIGQRIAVNQLERDFVSVGVRDVTDGSMSVIVECYDIDPSICLACARGEFDHADDEHVYLVPVPVRTFRVGPSGFRQDLTRAAVIA